MKKSPILVFMVIALCLTFSGCKKSGEKASNSKSDSANKTSQAEEAIDLQPKWVVGNRYAERMEIVQRTELAMPQMPKPVQQEVTMGQDYSITVLNARPGGGTGKELELEFLSMEMEVSMGGRSVLAFDSKGESLDDSKNSLASMF